MILLEPDNPMIKTILEKRFTDPEERKACHFTICDFDGVVYSMVSLKDPKELILSINIKAYDTIIKYGGMEKINDIYGKYICETSEGYNLSILINFEQHLNEMEKVIEICSNMRKNIIGSPFAVILSNVSVGHDFGGNVVEFKYRPKESIFVKPGQDRVSFIFQICFTDSDDQVLGEVFLKEFALNSTKIQGAPYVVYNNAPPQELKEFNLPKEKNVSYVTLILFNKHYTIDKIDTAIKYVPSMRNYMHYHLKCVKAYLHLRMRERVAEYLKVLDEAKPIDPTKSKKTISGKTFERK